LLKYTVLHLQYATGSQLDVSAMMLENKTFGTAVEMSGLLVSCTLLTASTNESVQKRNISPSTQFGAFYFNFIFISARVLTAQNTSKLCFKVMFLLPTKMYHISFRPTKANVVYGSNPSQFQEKN
jgi:hypothetical protein